MFIDLHRSWQHLHSFIYGTLLCLASLGLAITSPPNAQAQTGSSSELVVRGDAVPSPTPHDDWKAKLDHIMNEVSGTEITVTKKATVIKLDQQPPVENNNLQQLFTKAPGSSLPNKTRPVSSISAIAASGIRRNRNSSPS
ncbi:MAG: hypothetical protein ABI217_07140 [Chthoniobacterales bacterium]